MNLHVDGQRLEKVLDLSLTDHHSQLCARGPKMSNRGIAYNTGTSNDAS